MHLWARCPVTSYSPWRETTEASEAPLLSLPHCAQASPDDSCFLVARLVSKMCALGTPGCPHSWAAPSERELLCSGVPCSGAAGPCSAAAAPAPRALTCWWHRLCCHTVQVLYARIEALELSQLDCPPPPPPYFFSFQFWIFFPMTLKNDTDIIGLILASWTFNNIQAATVSVFKNAGHSLATWLNVLCYAKLCNIFSSVL